MHLGAKNLTCAQHLHNTCALKSNEEFKTITIHERYKIASTSKHPNASSPKTTSVAIASTRSTTCDHYASILNPLNIAQATHKQDD